jgi:hypothetical protein
MWLHDSGPLVIEIGLVRREEEFQRLHRQNGAKEESTITHVSLLVLKVVRNGAGNLNISSG